MPGTPQSRRRTRLPGAGAIQAFSLEAWPAAGGGLLLGMIVPALASAAPLRHPIKNLFLRIDREGQTSVIVPYARFEPEVLICATELVGGELDVPSECIAVAHGVAAPDGMRTMADLCPAAELGLTLIAATARTLLQGAAAEAWNIATCDCGIEQGMVRGLGLQAVYADLAADAALIPLPAVVFLASGRPVALRSRHG